ncbi:MAG: hypothetical protein EYC69_14500 [Bacteroidetes bacterium]|nr:MAG: hypothetical protein EYC69_14500 [Bacteroidota bacterium]
MRTFFLIILFLAATLPASYAQYESRKGYAGFSIGASLPQGDFANNSSEEGGAGFAKPGVALNLNFAYRIASNFGLTAMVLIQSNSLDESGFLNALNTSSNLAGTNRRYTSVDADSWGMSGFLVGGFASIPLGSGGKVILEPRALVGILTALSPRIKASYKEGFSNRWDEQQIGAGIGFGYGLGGSFRFNVSDRIALLLNADYLKTNPKFIDVVINTSYGQDFITSFQRKIEVVNVTLGFAFRIKKDIPPIRKRFDS